MLQRARWTLVVRDAEVAPEIDWEEARRRQDIADLEALDLPRWIKRLLINFRAWRQQP